MALSVCNMGGGSGGADTYPVSIEVTMPPTKTEYHPGEELNLAGMVVKAVFNDGSKQIITSQCTMSPANGSVLSKTATSVSISWVWPTLGNSYTTQQAITMMVASGIRIKTPPTKTAYKAGETFNTAGMVVVADYPDGETDITAQATITPANGAKIYESTTQVTVTWTDPYSGDNFTASKPITVTRVLSSITVSAPTKNTYKDGETLNLSGATVTAHFNSGATANVTSQATFNPANGTKLTGSGTVAVAASYTEGGVTKTGTTSVTVKPALEIVTWANGTDAQIAAMLEAHYAGTIDIGDYWKVGDEREVSLSAMAKGAVGETHVAQNVTLVLMHKGGKTLTTPVNGKSTCAFVVGQKNCLANGTTIEAGYMNNSDTNSGGWVASKRRTWCNETYRNALPASFKGLFKEFYNKNASGSGTTIQTATDYFALPSEVEVFGNVKYANKTAEADNTQFDYYKTSANRVKKKGDSGSAYYWWERSPFSGYSNGFCFVYSDGSANFSYASGAGGIAPFGCI